MNIEKLESIKTAAEIKVAKIEQLLLDYDALMQAN